jgi:hypothetical protein
MNISAHILTLQNIVTTIRSNYFLIPKDLRAYKKQPKTWSKKEILGHLIDSARYNLQRFTEIIHAEGIYIVKPYDQDTLVLMNDYQNTSDYDLISLWQLINQNIIRVLNTVDESLLKKQIIMGNEPFTFGWLIEDYIVHLHHHYDQIFDEDTSEIPPLKVGLDQAIEALNAAGDKKFVSLLHFADLEIEYYKPILADHQQPHLKDEVYVIASGQALFYTTHQTVSVKAGDVLYVKATDGHHFTDFSDDFATWVIFYGIKNQL